MAFECIPARFLDAEWYEAAEADRLLAGTPKKWRALIGLAEA